MINAWFYDIESLRNIFTLANFKDAEDPANMVLDIYYLCDTPELTSQLGWQARAKDRILERNKNFLGSKDNIHFLDLHKPFCVDRLASEFGCSDAKYINDPDAKSMYTEEKPTFRIVCDTDPEYQANPDAYPYIFGYNSYNYDTTMLAKFLEMSFAPIPREERDENGKKIYKTYLEWGPVTAEFMRDFNNQLFEPRWKSKMPSLLAETMEGPSYSATAWMIRKNMLMSGRHLDVARLNEKQQHVGLKRLLGMLGYQILESDKLDTGLDTIENEDQMLDLIAYNVSDIINLKNLFYHPQYQGQFELKKGLLQTYPELIYEAKGKYYKRPNLVKLTQIEPPKKGDDDPRDMAYRPNISQKTVRSDRLTIDSSSAQFSTKALCPYGYLRDIPAVSFLYPHPDQAKAMGIKPVNVLEEARKFFYSKYQDPQLRARFDTIYNYYKNIEGKNFNESEHYNEAFGHDAEESHNLNSVEKANTCIEYFDRDGNPTSCFVLFSTGGIHGAEYNVKLYQADREQWEADMADMAEAQRQYPNPVDLRKAKKITMPDGRELEYKVFLKNGLPIDKSQYKDLTSKEPLLFKEDKKGNYSLNKKYVFTSACAANHEDFTSYYPNLLRRMQAFYNAGLGGDRYAEIFEQKQTFGKLMKDKSLSEAERNHYRVLREGTKLILNSASGAADATFENNIRMNNQIISMRIIGQLFSWRIGQAQSYEGAFVPSTNTDGLYSVMEETKNNEILSSEAANIGVEIEPEPLFLISKDSNNRIEYDEASQKIISASGGTTGCRKGPNPSKSLAHPAIIDWALTEYLLKVAHGERGLNLEAPFDADLGLQILQEYLAKPDTLQTLLMYQNIIASSSSSVSYIYGVRSNDPEPVVLQNYNRMFIMKNETPETMHLYSATARLVTPAMRKKRAANNERPVLPPEPAALKVLMANGEQVNGKPVSATHYYQDKDIVTKKVTGIDAEWNVLIENRDLHGMTDAERAHIIDNLDIEKYLQMLNDAYTRNWMNHIPGVIYEEVDDTDSEEEPNDM